MRGDAGWRSPVVVGRDRELAALRSVGDAALIGGLRAAVLRGEPGIGKTRLAQAVVGHARQGAMRVYETRASPVDRDLAYGTVLSLLTPMLREDVAALADLPHLTRLFPHEATAVPRAARSEDAALDRTLLFEAVVRLIERRTAERPLLVVIDDIHLADDSSLQLLQYMCRRVADEPILLILTLRTGEVDVSPSLGGLLRDLQRTGAITDIRVDRLQPADVAAMASALLGGEPPEELLPILAGRGAGSPLAIEGIVRALSEAGALRRNRDGWTLDAPTDARLPDDLRDLIVERLARLTPDASALVDVVAVAGGALRSDLLAAASGLSHMRLRDALVVAEAAAIVVTLDEEWEIVHRLTHPLLQEVSASELAPLRRQRIHADLARAFDSLAPADLAQRSHHYRNAGTGGSPGRALDVFLAAAAAASAASAPLDAAQQLLAALRVVRRGFRIELLPMILESLGEAWAMAGSLDAASASWGEAADLLTTQPSDRVALARIHRRLAHCERDRGRLDAAVVHVREGFAVLGDADRGELAALHHAAIVVLGADVARARRLVDLADELDDPPVKVRAHLAGVAVALSTGDFDEARSHGEAALLVADAVGDPFLINRAHSEMCLTMWCLGDSVALRLHAQGGLRAARDVGSPALEAQMRRALMLAELLGGDLRAAVAAGDEAVDSARRFASARTLANNLIYRGWARVVSGDLDAAAADIAEAEAVFQAPQADQRTLLGLGIAAAQLALERNDVVAALAIAARFREDRGHAHGLELRLPAGLLVLAEAQAASGDTAAARDTAAALGRMGRAGGVATAFERRATAAALAAEGDAAAALTAFDAAAAGATALGLGFEAARCMLDSAEAAHAAADPSAVERAVAALEALERCGGRRHCERARRLLRRVGIHVRAPRPGRRSGSLLSGRELEVAQLVAEGLTNGEIAERLFLSPRTVTSHLDHIYGRLAIRSRAALARHITAAGEALPTP